MVLSMNNLKKNLKRTSILVVGFIAVIGIVLGTYQPVLAFGEKYDPLYYAGNNILFYNPEDTSCGDADLYDGPTDISSLKNNEANKAIFQKLLTSDPNKINAVMAAAIMGNMYGESGLDPTASEEPDGPGYGLAQWSTAGRKQGLETYASQNGGDKSNAITQTGYLLKEYNESFYPILKGTDFDNASDITKATTVWMEIFENPLEQTGEDPSGLNSRRIPAAIAIYGYYKDLYTETGTVTAETTESNCSSGVAAGDIVATAVGLALTEPFPNGSYERSSALTAATGYTVSRDTFQAAKPQYNPSVAWTDCGGFIATIMRASGVDPEYASVGVTVQRNYVRAHPEKYQIIENATAADLQPGDILYVDGHTTMYTGAETYPNVDASYGERVPSVRNSGNHLWMLGRNATLARFIGSTSAITNTAVGQ